MHKAKVVHSGHKKQGYCRFSAACGGSIVYEERKGPLTVCSGIGCGRGKVEEDDGVWLHISFLTIFKCKDIHILV